MVAGSNVIPMENLEGRMSGEAHRIMVRSAADGGDLAFAMERFGGRLNQVAADFIC